MMPRLESSSEVTGGDLGLPSQSSASAARVGPHPATVTPLRRQCPPGTEWRLPAPASPSVRQFSCRVFCFQGKFLAFYQYAKSFNSDDFDYEELKNGDYVFMRWKVRPQRGRSSGPHAVPVRAHDGRRSSRPRRQAAALPGHLSLNWWWSADEFVAGGQSPGCPVDSGELDSVTRHLPFAATG